MGHRRRHLAPGPTSRGGCSRPDQKRVCEGVTECATEKRQATVSQCGLWPYVRAHPGLALTFAYVCISALGLTYNWHIFMQFGVNILDYAAPADFFLAGLRHPVLTGSCLLFIAGHWGFMRLCDRFADPAPTFGWQLPVFLAATVCVIAIVFLVQSLKQVNELLCADEATVGIVRAGSDTTELVIVGTTSKYVMAFRPSDREPCSDMESAPRRPPMLVIPHSEIRNIEFRAIRAARPPRFRGRTDEHVSSAKPGTPPRIDRSAAPSARLLMSMSAEVSGLAVSPVPLAGSGRALVSVLDLLT